MCQTMKVYDLKHAGAQLHVKGDAASGTVKAYGQEHGVQLTAYQAAMAEASAVRMGIPALIRRIK